MSTVFVLSIKSQYITITEMQQNQLKSYNLNIFARSS